MKDLNQKDYWRSLNQLADTPEFRNFLEREFPEGASELSGGMDRRKFLMLMGASMALAGLTACRRPVEKIVPYVKAPEEIIPGIPKNYATTMPFGKNAYGIVVQTHEGRPTKVEGNSIHPSSGGGTNVFMQAAILNLYDPDRSQTNRQNGQDKTWEEFITYWQSVYPQILDKKGEGVAILSESSCSPTFFNLKNAFTKQFPKARWYSYEPVSDENRRLGVQTASGSDYRLIHHFELARVIISIFAFFLNAEEENVTHARGFANGRRIISERDKMNRLYVAESTFTLTGGLADHRLRLKSGDMYAFLVILTDTLKKKGLRIPGTESLNIPDSSGFDTKWLNVLAEDLISNRGAGLIIAGKHLPAGVHALVFALNVELGNSGKTVSYRRMQYELNESLEDIKQLVNDLNSDKIEYLFILGGNPVYNAPSELNFADALSRAKNKLHAGIHFNETARKCDWHLLDTHFLESWGDAQAVDGTLSIIQPMIMPLFNGHSSIEILNLISTGIFKSGYELVRDTWLKLLGKESFEKDWRRVLHDGVLEESGATMSVPSIRASLLNNYFRQNQPEIQAGGPENLEIVFYPSASVFDGRYSNNGWLQELPDAVTKLAWDNAAIMSRKTAESLGIKNQDLVVLNAGGREMALPAWILPGQADFSIALTLGYGRTAAGRIGDGVGFNTYRIRTSDAFWINTGVRIRITSEQYPLANSQDHGSMEGRPLVREATLKEYRDSSDFAPEMVEHPPLVSLWTEHSYDKGYQWGMSIDLNACTGCNACAIACQSENNIPIVGKEQVKRGREMHWMRMDRYFSGEVEDPEMVFQPMACQHCENAPCEQVCPVQATMHDSEGLNVMAYNRCIGTRYCSNNCPYKVRRFNFFNYTNQYPEIIKMVQNPDVTVRSRGVMEKCTYCLQRINEAKISAKNNNRILKDGEVVTACQQACPTNAIVFGNINDPDSEVVRMKKMNRDYAVLEELNVQPRTTYLARLRNPNPKLENA